MLRAAAVMSGNAVKRAHTVQTRQARVYGRHHAHVASLGSTVHRPTELHPIEHGTMQTVAVEQLQNLHAFGAVWTGEPSWGFFRIAQANARFLHTIMHCM